MLTVFGVPVYCDRRFVPRAHGCLPSDSRQWSFAVSALIQPQNCEQCTNYLTLVYHEIDIHIHFFHMCAAHTFIELFPSTSNIS